MTPEQESLLRKTYESSVRTEEHILSLREVQRRHAERITTLERWNWTLHGVWASIVATVTMFKDKIIEIFT